MIYDRYTAQSIQEIVSLREQELFESWSMGRPIGWKCDDHIKNSVCINNWMTQELSKLIASGFIGPDGIALSDDDRKIQLLTFNRWGRSRTDLFELAAEIMNEVLDGKILRNRIPLNRWG